MFPRNFAALATTLATVVAPAAAAACGGDPTGVTLNGTYTGNYLAEFKQEVFLGIRYAKAPRLHNPQPLTDSWTGPRSAQKYGALCPTTSPEEDLASVNATFSDDCLNLNIIRPAGVSVGDKIPVVVWIHGGSFSAGFGADHNTNTSYVIKASVENKMPIMTVTINYRLGFLGFPGGYQAEAAGILNLGLKDQRKALEWIQENIAGFGGDPGQVTLWGQSAGGIAIGHQILAYGGEGADELFRGAIMVSGTAGLATNAHLPTAPQCLKGYQDILTATGCADADDTLECLRGVDAFELYTAGLASATPSWWPMIDGDFIQGPATWQINAGRFSRNINIIAGANSDEAIGGVQLTFPGIDSEAELTYLMGFVFPAARPSTIQAVLDAYPDGAPAPPYSLPMEGDPFCKAMREAGFTACGSQFRRAAGILTDAQVVAKRRSLCQKYAEFGGKAYSYRFDTNPTDIPIDPKILVPGFTTHSAEYTYFFNFPPEYDMFDMNPPVRNISSHLQLSRGIVDKFVSFIATGDPNTFKVPFIPEWPPYSLSSPSNMLLNATASDNQINVRVEPDTFREKGIALWAKYDIELEYGSTWRPEA
ncbi:lipase [Plectosphaerella plurivora]|uniref:Carboxylic ester hydrolase n=1 Tax=Plectosphaerella plurivora TaxID=936078 RepID=A0A9P8VFC2_9PEZI|nr:lipase [Plectosphaerella plurivora]